MKLIVPEAGLFPPGDSVSLYNCMATISMRCYPIESFGCTISFPVVNGVTNQWIPNTDRKLTDVHILLPVMVNGQPNSGELDIGLMPPEDPNFALGDTQAGNNIFRNKGDGIRLYARMIDGSEVLLVTFTRNANPTSGEDSYTVVAGDCMQVFGTSAVARDGYRLYRDSLGWLTFQRGTRTSTSFCVQATPGTIRPGDDFLLRFLLRRTGSVACARAQDFLAVYDKLTLDEAARYLDSGITWTRRGDNQEMRAVAYSLGAKDTQERFVQEMQSQRRCIQWYYGDANPLWTEATPNPHTEWADWLSTTAPGGDWSNYLRWTGETGASGQIGTAGVTIGGTTYFPYRPNYNEDTGEPNYSVHGAGTDCNGFVQRAAQGRWLLPAITVNAGTGIPTGGSEKSCPAILNTYSFVLPNNARQLVVPGDVLVWDNPVAGGSDHIVIVYSVVPTLRSGAFVEGVSEAAVTVIEATYGRYMCVINTQTWLTLRTAVPSTIRNYNPGRLRPRN